VQSGGRRVTLFHVQDKSRIYGDLKHKLDEYNRIDRERLKRMEQSLKRYGDIDINIELPYGLPKQEIIRRLGQGDFSLIVMGTQGRGFFGKIFIGSVAHHITRYTTVPTLLIPPSR
jgi:nucleotide-binding universal stress UspA family protein